MSELLKAITLRQFRSYSESSFEFSDGVTIIIGPNAVGKTNLLEAVYVVSAGKGFRSSKDSEMLGIDKSWARLDAVYDKSERTVKLDTSSGRLQKSFIVGDQKKARLQYSDIRPVVLFQPDDLRLATGSPTRRRHFIDTLLSQLEPSYRNDIRSYERVLAQRNNLLKQSDRITSDHLFVWNIQLSERAGKIVRARTNLIDRINKVLSPVYSEIAGKPHKVKILYASSLPVDDYSNACMKKLQADIALDSRTGTTHTGPHRDDFEVLIDSKSMKHIGSRGENRTLLLALKIIELEELASRHETAPLLLLDDVFSELDGSRRALLTKYLQKYQTLITTTDADVVGKDFAQVARIISLEAS